MMCNSFAWSIFRLSQALLVLLLVMFCQRAVIRRLSTDSRLCSAGSSALCRFIALNTLVQLHVDWLPSNFARFDGLQCTTFGMYTADNMHLFESIVRAVKNGVAVCRQLHVSRELAAAMSLTLVM